MDQQATQPCHTPTILEEGQQSELPDMSDVHHVCIDQWVYIYVSIFLCLLPLHLLLHLQLQSNSVFIYFPPKSFININSVDASSIKNISNISFHSSNDVLSAAAGVEDPSNQQHLQIKYKLQQLQQELSSTNHDGRGSATTTPCQFLILTIGVSKQHQAGCYSYLFQYFINRDVRANGEKGSMCGRCREGKYMRTMVLIEDALALLSMI